MSALSRPAVAAILAGPRPNRGGGTRRLSFWGHCGLMDPSQMEDTPWQITPQDAADAGRPGYGLRRGRLPSSLLLLFLPWVGPGAEQRTARHPNPQPRQSSHPHRNSPLLNRLRLNHLRQNNRPHRAIDARFLTSTHDDTAKGGCSDVPAFGVCAMGGSATQQNSEFVSFKAERNTHVVPVGSHR